eukprot:2513228-Rhodomonas_salina.3
MSRAQLPRDFAFLRLISGRNRTCFASSETGLGGICGSRIATSTMLGRRRPTLIGAYTLRQYQPTVGASPAPVLASLGKYRTGHGTEEQGGAQGAGSEGAPGSSIRADVLGNVRYRHRACPTRVLRNIRYRNRLELTDLHRASLRPEPLR